MRPLEGQLAARARSPIFGQLDRCERGHLAGHRHRHLLRHHGVDGGNGEGCGSDDALHFLPSHLVDRGDDVGRPEIHRCRNLECLQSQKQPAQASE